MANDPIRVLPPALQREHHYRRARRQVLRPPRPAHDPYVVFACTALHDLGVGGRHPSRTPHQLPPHPRLGSVRSLLCAHGLHVRGHAHPHRRLPHRAPDQLQDVHRARQPAAGRRSLHPLVLAHVHQLRFPASQGVGHVVPQPLHVLPGCGPDSLPQPVRFDGHSLSSGKNCARAPSDAAETCARAARSFCRGLLRRQASSTSTPAFAFT